MKLIKAGFAFGEVRYRPEISGRRETVETTKGDGVTVTVRNSERPDRPAHYTVAFLLECDFEEGPLRFSVDIPVSVAVAGLPKAEPYGSVEAEAARRLAPMLRAVADQIDDQVTRYDLRERERPGPSSA